ncbi:hypothetical protein HG535_0B04740 [Zygotorulaspora mrakii]|uniref:Cell wall mannoprotein PIR1-like C-terminal domain-containing protein n=1 Tax=Zygotorulaspora mrakii TaxID=42260 RepID=A0A7H9B0W9_ZYGMR|nr:uncharacterized protein HG535_0B04740 [Zygotorulaspora mrakii]QLG71432.1 hypothetical protein HG535_0B04740 [Zygotorulaspora mrakii]
MRISGQPSLFRKTYIKDWGGRKRGCRRWEFSVGAFGRTPRITFSCSDPVEALSNTFHTEMQFKKTIITTAFAATALSAYVPSEPWSTLTPTATYSGGATDHATAFGIAVNPVANSSSASLAKRDGVSQIGDGQIQAATTTRSTAAPVSQISDGQIQATAATRSTAAPVSQISDGQIQATTATRSTAALVSQISDGQIQATTATRSTAAPVSQISDGQIQATTATRSTAAPVSQISDGQIQATTATRSTAAPVSQISDGQIQATTATSSADAISQISDGQIQATTSAHTTDAASQVSDGQVQATSTTSGASQVSDGQVQATSGASADSSNPVRAVSCKTDGTLEMNLKAGILTDNRGRIGSIVSNRQFQFDGPPPQAGAIYAAGWSITPEGNLAIGENDVFYQCLSGSFYNLYDESLGEQCHPVHLEVIDLIDC